MLIVTSFVPDGVKVDAPKAERVLPDATVRSLLTVVVPVVAPRERVVAAPPIRRVAAFVLNTEAAAVVVVISALVAPLTARDYFPLARMLFVQRVKSQPSQLTDSISSKEMLTSFKPDRKAGEQAAHFELHNEFVFSETQLAMHFSKQAPVDFFRNLEREAHRFGERCSSVVSIGGSLRGKVWRLAFS